MQLVHGVVEAVIASARVECDQIKDGVNTIHAEVQSMKTVVQDKSRNGPRGSRHERPLNV